MAGSKLAPLPGLPSEVMLTRVVLPDFRSWTKTSSARLRSPATRPVASEAKATKRPLAESDGLKLSSLPWTPSEPTLTREVRPDARSWTKTSEAALLSPATRLSAKESKATTDPSPDTTGLVLSPSAGPPPGASLTRMVCPFNGSCTKTLSARTASGPARFVAIETKATVDPSPDRLGPKLSALPCVPSVATESKAVTADSADDGGGGGAALTAEVPKSVKTRT